MSAPSRPLQVEDAVKVLANRYGARRYTKDGTLGEKWQPGEFGYVSRLNDTAGGAVYVVPGKSQIGMYPYNLMSIADLELVTEETVALHSSPIVDVNTLLKDL